MTAGDDAAELVRRARAGDRDAFAALAEAHLPRLERYLVTMTGDEHAASDLRQESARLAFERLDQLRQPERFGSWLLSIACNRCRSWLKQAVQRAADGDEALTRLADGHRSPLSSLVRREDAERLRLAIDRLPILLREAFVLFCVEGLPYAEIAAVTDVAEGTLQVRVHRAKALLRQQLGPVVDTWVLRG
ncbi:MAG: RNA polymerase sigma factor [Planctomycetes bacterium]|nr:RNA polymerase sigma factor [Planctomycetota bacterium]